MNKLLRAMQNESNYKLTENGGVSLKSTMNGLMDLFALGGAYRCRTDEDCIVLFKKAFAENESMALKCLFYLRDIRGNGQGERRFFRVICKWLANEHTEAIRRNMSHIATVGRWDDFYTFVDTPLEYTMFRFLKDQLFLDLTSTTPSLLAKWLKSENTSSRESRMLATKTRLAFSMSSKEYRKMLSVLRNRIRVLERLMSENRWDEIEFDKIPSKAGLVYRNAFARRDIIKEKYQKFAKSKDTKVNADALYPCEVVNQARKAYYEKMDSPNRLMVNKYWDNLTDYFNGATFDGVAVVDTSASMRNCGYSASFDTIKPIDVAIALGMYCGEKCGPNSPWYGNYITFSRRARLVPIVGADFVDKVRRIEKTNLCENTNIESVFNLILDLAVENRIPDKEMPKNVIIISDQEFDRARDSLSITLETVMEGCMRKWERAGYTLPNLVFWNVNARNDNIPMHDNGQVTFVSGYSPTLFKQIMSGKTGLDFVIEALLDERYKDIH